MCAPFFNSYSYFLILKNFPKTNFEQILLPLVRRDIDDRLHSHLRAANPKG